MFNENRIEQLERRIYKLETEMMMSYLDHSAWCGFSHAHIRDVVRAILDKLGVSIKLVRTGGDYIALEEKENK